MPLVLLVQFSRRASIAARNITRVRYVSNRVRSSVWSLPQVSLVERTSFHVADRLGTEGPISDPSSRNDGDLDKRDDRVHRVLLLSSRKTVTFVPLACRGSHVFRSVSDRVVLLNLISLKLRIRGTESSTTAEENTLSVERSNITATITSRRYFCVYRVKRITLTGDIFS